MWAKTTRKTYSNFIDKNDVGKVKPANYELPGSNHTYGKSGGNDKYGVRESNINPL